MPSLPAYSVTLDDTLEVNDLSLSVFCESSLGQAVESGRSLASSFGIVFGSGLALSTSLYVCTLCDYLLLTSVILLVCLSAMFSSFPTVYQIRTL